VSGALDALAQRQPGKRPVDVWVGMSKGAEERTKVVVAWDPVETGSSGQVAALDVTVTTAPSVEVVPLQSPAAPGTGKPSRVAAAFEVAPGPFSLKYTARAADQSTMDSWSQRLTAPDWSTVPLTIATPRFFLAQSISELRALRASSDPPPSAVRQFGAATGCSWRSTATRHNRARCPWFRHHVLTREGKELTELPVPALKDGSVLFELPVGSLGQGTYILRVRATLGVEQAEDMTAIVIAR